MLGRGPAFPRFPILPWGTRVLPPRAISQRFPNYFFLGLGVSSLPPSHSVSWHGRHVEMIHVEEGDKQCAGSNNLGSPCRVPDMATNESCSAGRHLGFRGERDESPCERHPALVNAVCPISKRRQRCRFTSRPPAQSPASPVSHPPGLPAHRSGYSCGPADSCRAQRRGLLSHHST